MFRTKLSAAFVGALLIALLWSCAQRAAAANKPAAQQPSPSCLAAQPAPDERGTVQKPLVVNATLPPKTDEEKAKEAIERKWRHSVDEWTVGASIATILVLFGQGIAFVVQAHRLRQSVEEMRRATQATRDVALAEQQTLETMERNARRELKAYVFVAGHVLQRPGIGLPINLKVTLTVRNFGKTPAYKLRVDVRVAVAREIGEQEERVALPVGTLGPGATFTVDAFSENITQRQMDQVIDNDQLKVFVFGRVDYEDAFENAGRWMTFRLMTVGSAGGKEPWTKLVTCEAGNDSDAPE